MNKQEPLRVGVSVFPPFVFQRSGRPVGFEIELWEKITKEIGVSSSYEFFHFQELLSALEKGRIDVAIAGLTLTEEREEVVDFSHRTFDSGLHILISKRARRGIFHSFRSVLNIGVGSVLALLVCFVSISAHLMWLAEKGGGGSLDGAYATAIFDALWWAITTLSTVGYGDYVPVTGEGKLVATATILFGISIFGLAVGQMSSSIMEKKLRSDITTPEDLSGKVVATVAHSVSEQSLLKYGASVMPVSSIDIAYAKLDTGDADAVVFDAPVLLRYALHEGRSRVAVVGGLFERQGYGFAFQEGSAFREEVNRTILKMYENGEYAASYLKWFGERY